MKSFLVCTYTSASCSSSYVGRTCHHFKTRIEEHIKKENKSHIFKHLHSTALCFGSYNSLFLKIIDKANSKVKEALHINLRKPNLASAPLACCCLYFFLIIVFWVFFHLPFLSSLTLITGIFYCLNYTFLLLYLITTQLVSHLSLSSIVFIISMLTISIFYCLHYTSLLLHLFTTHLVTDFKITM